MDIKIPSDVTSHNKILLSSPATTLVSTHISQIIKTKSNHSINEKRKTLKSS